MTSIVAAVETSLWIGDGLRVGWKMPTNQWPLNGTRNEGVEKALCVEKTGPSGEGQIRLGMVGSLRSLWLWMLLADSVTDAGKCPQPAYLRFESLELIYRWTQEVITSDPRQCLTACSRQRNCKFANFDGRICQLIPKNNFQDELDSPGVAYFRKFCPGRRGTRRRRRKEGKKRKNGDCPNGYPVRAQRRLTGKGARGRAVRASTLDECFSHCLRQSASNCAAVLFYDDADTTCLLFDKDHSARNVYLKKEKKRLVDYVRRTCTDFDFHASKGDLPFFPRFADVSKASTAKPRVRVRAQDAVRTRNTRTGQRKPQVLRVPKDPSHRRSSRAQTSPPRLQFSATSQNTKRSSSSRAERNCADESAVWLIGKGREVREHYVELEARSADACTDLCRAERRCKGASFVGGSCRLSPSSQLRRGLVSSEFVLKACPTVALPKTCERFLALYPGQELRDRGSQLSWRQAISLSSCLDFCLIHPSCRSLSFHHSRPRNNCRLSHHDASSRVILPADKTLVDFVERPCPPRDP